MDANIKSQGEYDHYFSEVIERADCSILDAMDLLPAKEPGDARGYLMCGGNGRVFHFHITGDMGPIKKGLADKLGHDESLLSLFKSIIRHAEDILKDYKSQFTAEEWDDND